MTLNETLAKYPNITRLVEAVINEWPQHENFLIQRFVYSDANTLPLCDQISQLVLQLSADDLSLYCRDYRWMCDIFVAEDLHFRRTGCLNYRIGSSEEADRLVYSQSDFMSRYLKGILISQALWFNQTVSFQFYLDSFLSRIEPNSSFLEIGPGHGLLLYFAARCSNVKKISGWDISDSSIAMTQDALNKFRVNQLIYLTKRDILQPIKDTETFNAIVISEVLEHLDRPDLAVQAISNAIRPEGLVFFNVPINSPAPDHVFNWHTVEAVKNFVLNNGFNIITSTVAPMTGYDLELALQRKVTVNVLIVAQKNS